MTDVYSKVIHYDEVKGTQVRLTINEFRDVEYLHIRKYYEDFDGDWRPSSEGISMPLGIDNSSNLFEASAEIISTAETNDIIKQYFGDIIASIYVPE